MVNNHIYIYCLSRYMISGRYQKATKVSELYLIFEDKNQTIDFHLYYIFTNYSKLQYIFTFVGTSFEQGVGVSMGLNFTIVDVYIHIW